MSPKQAVALNLAAKAERKRERARIGKLSATVVAPATLKRYETAVRWFYDAVAMNHLDLNVDLMGV